jgi:hypothetical protein
MLLKLTVAIALLLGYLVIKLRAYDRAYLEMNQADWKINLLPKPSLFIRIFNIVVGKNGAALLITLLEKTRIKLALNKSFKQMKAAEVSGKVPAILCNATARKALKGRLTQYAQDMRGSDCLNPYAKIFLYSGALVLLADQVGLLQLGMEAHAEIVRNPVFIVSMPRTATTILQRTMATDTSRWRTFDLADMMKSFPPIPRSDRTARKKYAEKIQKTMVNPFKLFFPGWFECLATMDYKALDQIDEDLGLCNPGIGVAYQDTLIHLHSQGKSSRLSLESAELATFRFAWLDMMLRIHQKLDPDNDRTWLMKDPKHSAFLPQLMQQFPDARLIFIHRPPGDIVASMAKLFLCFTCISVIPGASGTSSAEWGQYALEKTKFYSDGIVRYSRTHPLGEDKRIDILFSELILDVVGSIEHIYEICFNEKPSAAAKVNMQVYLDHHPRKKNAAQPRSLQDFHLAEKDITFSEYRKMFLKFQTSVGE